ncbi:Nn.00g076990.m01.CDS01 [Neocucurbitaria sp. VM-36]
MSTNIDMIASPDNAPNLASANHDAHMLETATPNNIKLEPSTIYGVEEPVLDVYVTLNNDATMTVAPQGADQISITSEDSLRPRPEHSNGMSVALDAADDFMMNKIARPITIEKDWRTSMNFQIPSCTQASITDIPQLQMLYNAYHASYTDLAITNDTHMQHAKALAFALLTHYFPPSQGYIVEPSSLGPVSKHGMNFIRTVDDASDIWQDLSAKKPTKKAKGKGGLTKKQKEIAELAAKTNQYNHGMEYIQNLQWDWIKPEDIAGFVVMRKAKVTEKEPGIITYEHRSHTYLAIMIDNFDQVPRFSTANITHRSDVLADALCRIAKIQHGYGILLYGPRIEFYAYDAGKAWTYYKNDDDDITVDDTKDNSSDDEAQDIEPVMQSFQHKEGTEDLAMDMRTESLQAVGQAFQMIATQQVTYTDGVVVDARAEQHSSAVGDMEE